MKRKGLLTLILGLLALRAAVAETMVTFKGHVAPQIKTATKLERIPADERIDLSLTLNIDQKALDQAIANMYGPTAPKKKQYLTPSEFAQKFGLAEKRQKIKEFAQANGLTIDAANDRPESSAVKVYGASSLVENAFHVKLHHYRGADGKIFRAHDEEPTIPASLQPHLGSIGGLSYIPGLWHPASPLLPSIKRSGVSPAGTLIKPLFALGGASGPGGGLSPTDIKTIYGLNSTTLDGSGQTIAVLEEGGYTPSDITAYETYYGLPTAPDTIVSVDGVTNTYVAYGDEMEEVLDIQMIKALAPKAKLYVYQGFDLNDIFNQMAIDNTAKVISVSFGGLESTLPQSYLEAENQIFERMALQGQTVFVASGDYGAYNDFSATEDNTTPSVCEPASQPFVTGVGGTSLRNSVQSPSEITWNDGVYWNGGGISGGGVSAIWPIPSFQVGVSGTASQQFRNVPDVALNADADTAAYSIYIGGWAIAGGTSAGAPLWAATMALVNQQRATLGEGTLGFANPALYQLGTSASYHNLFNDITSGNNGYYNAGPGYDNTTGWGTFLGRGSALINALAGLTTPTPVISPASANATATVGSPFSYTVSASNASQASYSATGLPSSGDLTLNPNTGVISGTPSAADVGSYAVSIVVTNGGGTSAVATLALKIAVPPNSSCIADAACGAGNYCAATAIPGSGFCQPISSATVTVSQPTPNEVFTLSPTNCPDVQTQTNFVAAATGLNATAAAAASVEVTLHNTLDVCQSQGVTCNSASYSHTFTAADIINNTAPSVVATAYVPDVSGALISVGKSQAFSLTLAGCQAFASNGPPPIVTGTLSATAPVGQAFSYTIQASNNPTSFGATGLPPSGSLTLNTKTGVISGTPSAADIGTYNVSLTITNGGGTISVTLVLTISQPAPSGQLTVSPATVSLPASGTLPITFTFSASGFTPNSAYGVHGISNPSGSINAPLVGTWNGNSFVTGPYPYTSSVPTGVYTYQAEDAAGNSYKTTITLQAPSLPVITSLLTGTGQVGQPFTYQITATNSPTSFGASGLPTGLAVNPQTGVISGTPSTAGTTNATIYAYNGAGSGQAAWVITITNAPPVLTPVITSLTPPGGTVGQPYSYQITATNNPFTYLATGFPPGLSLNSTTGQVSGTPTTAGSFNGTVYAFNVNGSGQASWQITVVPAAIVNPVVQNCACDTGADGLAPSGVSLLVTASCPSPGNQLTMSWTAYPGVAGYLPDLLTSGSTSNPCGETQNQACVDNNMSAGSQNNIDIIVQPHQVSCECATPITCAKTPAPTATAQSVTTAFNTAKAITLTGTDPNSLPLTFTVTSNPAHGTLTGTAPNLTYTPSSYAGADSFSFVANNGYVNSPAAAISMTVTNPAAPTASTQTITTAFNTAKAITLTGTDPNGLNLTYTVTANPMHGALTGTAPNLTYTPTKGFSGADSFSFTANNGFVNSSTAAVVSITVSLPSPPTASAQTVTTAFNTAKAVTLTGTDPNGLNLTYAVTASPTHGALTGTAPNLTYTPTNGYAGADSLSFTANNGYVTSVAAAVVSITVLAPPPPPPVITSAATATGAQGSPFTYAITATNNPTSFSATQLPAGLSLNTTTGLITGTPSSFGSLNVIITATNGGGYGNANLMMTINPPPPVINSPLSVAGSVGQAFTYQITTVNGASSCSATGLPASGSLTLNAGLCLISGTPKAADAGTYNVTLTATYLGVTSAPATLRLTIIQQLPAITSALSASALTGQAFTYQMTATNSPTSFGASGLPAGLGINSTTGLISGTPNQAGSFTVQLSMTNSAGTSTANLSLTIASGCTPNPSCENYTCQGQICSDSCGNAYPGIMNCAPPPPPPPPAPSITSAANATVVVGSSFIFTITATNNPTSFNAVGLPAGLSINTTNGVISGTSSSIGTFSVTISVTNAGGIATAVLTLTIQPQVSDTVWVEDSLPAGAISAADGGDTWNWVNASPTPYSGSFANQSAIASGEHEHYFSGATTTLSVNTGDALIAYVYLDPSNPPSEVMLQWNDAGSWEHRAYWGADQIAWGSDGSVSRVYMGPLPATGQWIRLSVPASALGLEQQTLNGMAFTLYGGRATWDHAGKSATVGTLPVITSAANGMGIVGSSFTYTITATNNPTSFNAVGLPAGLSINTVTGAISGVPTVAGTSSVTLSATNAGGTATAVLTLTIQAQSSDTVWVEDSLPAGAISAADGGDAWNWVSANPTPYSGSLANQSAIASGEHEHYFYGATNTLSVNTGDALIAYVYLDPSNPPSEVMLQWNSVGGWEHRAYWGADQISWGSDGSVSRVYMGPLPTTGQWIRLSVPASALGLEQQTVSGMAFVLYGGRATWDHAGKSGSGITSNVVTTGPADTLSGGISVNVYPNPWKPSLGVSSIQFKPVPDGSAIKIFTVSGHWVTTLSAPSGFAPWDLTNNAGQKVASGIYIYLVTDPQGNKATGKVVLIR